ncbi:MAG: type II toxin-antitoxin system RelE/ParE family toxin [Deltaproteobacteria bacterium]|nr:type II toxin-antitoxin system RelE/ParE family toxin [Deltaproteobacteria bacterium]MBI5810516.1 type II toxin-antitoxin system RelE/ParE family toxin [Deltaproteobacteria bacterium]
MIKTFADRETANLYLTGKSKKFSSDICKIGVRKLDYLNAASALKDLRIPPGNRLEQLKGKYEGKFSIRINNQYRIIFGYVDSDAYDVEITDYH